MGEVAWRVSPVDGSAEPKLLINSDKELNIMLKLDKGEEIWRSLIFPNALEQILYILVKSYEDDGENRESWVTKWVNYFENENFEEIPSSNPDEAEAVKDWVEEIVKAISDRGQFFEKLKEKLNPMIEVRKFNDDGMKEFYDFIIKTRKKEDAKAPQLIFPDYINEKI